MNENDYIPGACPVCGAFGYMCDFMYEYQGGKYQMKCPDCGAYTDIYPNPHYVLSDWIDGKVYEDGGGDA